MQTGERGGKQGNHKETSSCSQGGCQSTVSSARKSRRGKDRRTETGKLFQYNRGGGGLPFPTMMPHPSTHTNLQVLTSVRVEWGELSSAGPPGSHSGAVSQSGVNIRPSVSRVVVFRVGD